MTVPLASIAAYAVPVILLLAVIEHLSRPASLARALAAHRVLPTAPLVATAVVTAEALLAGGVLLGLLRADGTRALGAALAGSAVLFALYGGYALLVIASGRGGPCGCSRMELPMDAWVVIRAFALAALALLGAASAGDVLRPGDGPTGDLPAGSLAVVLAAGVTFATLLWHLPAAMYDPARVAAPAVAGPSQEGRSG